MGQPAFPALQTAIERASEGWIPGLHPRKRCSEHCFSGFQNERVDDRYRVIPAEDPPVRWGRPCWRWRREHSPR